ncbi:MAG: class I SAM-dependent methyltransferase [Patescibacteria group bacterium]
MDPKVYYDAAYARKGNCAMRPRWVYERWFRCLGQAKPHQSMLDVGCGTGLLLQVADGYGMITTGLDLSDEAVKLSRKNSPHSTVVQGNGEHLPFLDKQFDYVCCVGSLEHYRDPAQGLRELVRVAKDDAKFLIVLPNDNYLFWKLKKIQKGTAQREFEVLKNLAGWKRFLVDCGLEILEIHQDRYPAQELKIFQYKNPYTIARRLLYKLIWWLMPLNLTYQFVFVLKKSTAPL